MLVVVIHCHWRGWLSLRAVRFATNKPRAGKETRRMGEQNIAEALKEARFFGLLRSKNRMVVAGTSVVPVTMSNVTVIGAREVPPAISHSCV